MRRVLRRRQQLQCSALLPGLRVENKSRLREIDGVLLSELENFETGIISEIDHVTREFMNHQTNYAQDV